MKYNYKILIAAALEMTSHLTSFPSCLAGICLVPCLFLLWVFIVLFIDFSALFPSPAHRHNALLGGHAARSPARPPLAVIKSYKNIAKFTEWQENIADSTTWYENIAGFTEGKESIGGFAPPKPTSMTVYGLM